MYIVKNEKGYKIYKEEIIMDRIEKIDAMIEFFDDNHIKIIDLTTIGCIVIDAEFSMDKDYDEYEYQELIDKGFSDIDIAEFRLFLENKEFMMIKPDDISGVSFENAEYSDSNLYDEVDLWAEDEENSGIEKEEKIDEESGVE